MPTGPCRAAPTLAQKTATYLCITLQTLLVALSSQTLHADELRIGVLAYQGAEQALSRWQASADYLSTALPEHHFRIVPLNLADMQVRTADASLDFVLTNPGHYVVLEARFGVSRIATLVGSGNGPELDRFASVIFSRRGGPVRTLADIAGHRFAAVSPQAFGGFQLAQWTLLQRLGLDLLDTPERLLWTGFPQRDIVRAVLSGRADSGTVRTGVLEAMAADGSLDLVDLNILGQRNGSRFPYLRSTILVPQWPLSKLADTPEPLARRVAIALLNQSADHPASRAAGIGGWTIPSDYRTVHTVLRDLGIGPYHRPPLDWRGLLTEYGWPLAAATLALLAALGFSIHTARMNRRLAFSRQRLQREVEQRRKMQQALAQHSDELEQRVAERSQQLQQAEEQRRLRQAELTHVARVAAAGELVGGLAHELNQPLTVALNYANGCQRHLSRPSPDLDRVADGLRRNTASIERASEVLSTLRDFVRTGELSSQSVLLNEQLDLVLDLMAAELRDVQIDVEHPDDAANIAVHANPVHIQQVLVNLLRNALDALAEIPPQSSRIHIVLQRRHGTAGLCITDNGHGLPAGEQREHLLDSFITTKQGGLGMGLSISRSLLESHGGDLTLEDAPGGGARACFHLPEPT